LWMESGATAPKGKVFIGLHELLAVRAGFAPVDFLHLDLTYLAPYDHHGAGAKLRILPPMGIFQGLAVRAEVGRRKQGSIMRPIQTYTGAVSLGSDKIKLHLDYTAERLSVDDGALWRKRARVGGSLLFPQDDPACLQSLNVEAWFDATSGVDDRFEVIGAALRTSKRRFVWEVGFLMVPNVNVIGDGPGTTYPLPYLSASWYI